MKAGERLRALREQCGLSLRSVQAASIQIASERGNESFVISPSCLSCIEAKNMVPSIHRLYSLALIYRRDMRELLAWYGVDLENTQGAGFRVPAHATLQAQSSD